MVHNSRHGQVQRLDLNSKFDFEIKVLLQAREDVRGLRSMIVARCLHLTASVSYLELKQVGGLCLGGSTSDLSGHVSKTSHVGDWQFSAENNIELVANDFPKGSRPGLQPLGTRSSLSRAEKNWILQDRSSS